MIDAAAVPNARPDSGPSNVQPKEGFHMSDTTTLTRLERIKPKSETHWRAVAARAHRLMPFPGMEAAARTHEAEIYAIRNGEAAGSSRGLVLCPRCLERGARVALIWMGGTDKCGTCLWPGKRD